MRFLKLIYKGDNMKVFIHDRKDLDSGSPLEDCKGVVIENAHFVPRIGDRIKLFRKPYPKVVDILLDYETNEIDVFVV